MAKNINNHGGFFADSPLNDDELYTCVHCGFCLSACPTYLETGSELESPRGRIALMKAVRENRLEVTPTVVKHWDLCIQCQACEVVCPSGVPYGRLMEATREAITKHHPRPIKTRLVRRLGYRYLLGSMRLLRVVGTLLRFYQKSAIQAGLKKLRVTPNLPLNLGSLDEMLPPLDDVFFKADGRVSKAKGQPRAVVSLLAGCVMTLTHAHALEAAIRVLNKNGVEVRVPSAQGCCGALNTHAGENNQARVMAKRNIDALLQGSPDAIISASAGCGARMKEYYELLKDSEKYATKATRFSALTKDLHEFLDELQMVSPDKPLEKTVVYQDACHLANAQHITAAPRRLLDAIPKLHRVEMAGAGICCGSGGTYSVTEPAMSARLGKAKARNILASQPDIVATGNPGCAIQIQNWLRKSGSNIEVKFVVELLDEAYTYDHNTDTS